MAHSHIPVCRSTEVRTNRIIGATYMVHGLTTGFFCLSGSCRYINRRVLAAEKEDLYLKESMTLTETI